MLCLAVLTPHAALAQHPAQDETNGTQGDEAAKGEERSETDSSYIYHYEEDREPDKILHAEPLFIDLIRDLGARKGEKEWNLGFGLTDATRFDRYDALVEYEWAPFNRVGMEVELPFRFYSRPREPGTNTPSPQLVSLKLASQYTYLVSGKLKLSAAVGTIYELEFHDFGTIGNGDGLVAGHVVNPFLIVAKRWGKYFHTLLYTGPRILYHQADQSVSTVYEANTNLHVMIPGTRNFAGIEVNKAFTGSESLVTLRPQIRVGIMDNLLLGLVGAIPLNRDANDRMGLFTRLIFEPGHRHLPKCPPVL